MCCSTLTQAARAKKERARQEKAAAEEAERQEVSVQCALELHRAIICSCLAMCDYLPVPHHLMDRIVTIPWHGNLQADRQEALVRAEQRRMAIERANKVLFDAEDDVKALHSKLLLSEVRAGNLLML